MLPERMNEQMDEWRLTHKSSQWKESYLWINPALFKRLTLCQNRSTHVTIGDKLNCSGKP